MSETIRQRQLLGIPDLEDGELDLQLRLFTDLQAATELLAHTLEARKQKEKESWQSIIEQRATLVRGAFVGTQVTVTGNFVTINSYEHSNEWWKLYNAWIWRQNFKHIPPQTVTINDVREVEGSFLTEKPFGNVFAVLIEDEAGLKQVGHFNYSSPREEFYQGLTIIEPLNSEAFHGS